MVNWHASPLGSTRLTGLLAPYPYRLASAAEGSGWRKRPRDGL
jgi:hypothetical protein